MATYIKTIQPVAMWHNDKETFRLLHFSEDERNSHFYGGYQSIWGSHGNIDMELHDVVVFQIDHDVYYDKAIIKGLDSPESVDMYDGYDPEKLTFDTRLWKYYPIGPDQQTLSVSYFASNDPNYLAREIDAKWLYNKPENEIPLSTINSFTEKYLLLEFNNYPGARTNKNISLTVQYQSDILPPVVPTYPINAIVKKKNQLIISWNYNPGESPIGQTSYSVKITQNGIDKTFTGGTEPYCVIPPNTLESGDASYTVTVFTKEGESSTSDTFYFAVTGETNAPDITNVSQTSVPTIEWNATYQDAYEIKLFEGSTLLYESGLKTGADVRREILPIMIKDGIYNVQVRILNIYGYYTEWSSYSFSLETESPQSPIGVKASVNENHGVEITSFAPDDLGLLYVVRRDMSGKEVVLGRYLKKFTDYTAKPNTPYEYTVRNYKTGYADGDWIAVRVVMDGAVLYSSDFSTVVNLDSSKNLFEITRDENNQRSLVNCLGRPYPVKEGTEWITSIRKFEAFVPSNKLIDVFSLSNDLKVYYKAENEFFACDVTVSDSGNYVTGGKILKFTITRIDETEVNVL